MEVFKIRYKIFIALMIMLSLLSLSCVNANDSNSTDAVLELNDDISQEPDLELSNDGEDNLEITADEEILSSNDSNVKPNYTFKTLCGVAC